MGAPYGNRRIGTYAVELQVLCSRLPCAVEDEAAVRAGSCEEARVGVMRVLRWRGWQLGKHAATLCPKHAPAPIVCACCGEATPPFYIDKVGSVPFFREAVPELKDLPAGAPLCDGCRGRARKVVFAWHQTGRSGDA